MESFDKAKDNLELTYDLASWFMQTYGDYSYEPKAYVMPKNVTVNIAELEEKAKSKKHVLKVLRSR